MALINGELNYPGFGAVPLTFFEGRWDDTVFLIFTKWLCIKYIARITAVSRQQYNKGHIGNFQMLLCGKWLLSTRTDQDQV